MKNSNRKIEIDQVVSGAEPSLLGTSGHWAVACTLASYFLMTLAIGAPQEDPRQARFDKIMEDSARVSLSMRTDRADYLPGEAATFILSIKNNTSQRL